MTKSKYLAFSETRAKTAESLPRLMSTHSAFNPWVADSNAFLLSWLASTYSCGGQLAMLPTSLEGPFWANTPTSLAPLAFAKAAAIFKRASQRGL